MFKFGFKSKEKKIENSIKEAKEIIKKDYNIVKQDLQKVENIAKQDIKKLESNEKLDIFFTYGWAIAVIILGIIGFIWWQYFNIDKESCEFLEGSYLLCENFDVTNSSLTLEIRNLNNKTVTMNEMKVSSCAIKPGQKISDNDKKKFSIPCNISSGRFRERLVVSYSLDDFEKHTVASLSKIVP
jgi:hypothetical protein